MPYQFTFTDRFEKHFKALTAHEKKQIMKKLDLLAENPSHPSLRVKRIQGVDDLYECSINMDIRVVWHYEFDAVITLTDIGHHDILRRF